MTEGVHVEVACDLAGLRITRELRSGSWELDGWGQRIVVREWTWAERRRLLEACGRGPAFDRRHFVAGLLALCCEPVPPAPLWSLYAHIVLDLLGIDGERALPAIARAELRLAECFDWGPAQVGPQSAVDLDRLLAELGPAPGVMTAPTAPPAMEQAVPLPGWRKIVVEQ